MYYSTFIFKHFILIKESRKIGYRVCFKKRIMVLPSWTEKSGQTRSCTLDLGTGFGYKLDCSQFVTTTINKNIYIYYMNK